MAGKHEFAPSRPKDPMAMIRVLICVNVINPYGRQLCSSFAVMWKNRGLSCTIVRSRVPGVRSAYLLHLACDGTKLMPCIHYEWTS